MVMKGGLLMAIRYRSSRFTKDIDFSTTRTLKELDLGTFRREFEAALALVVAESDYGLDCRLQGFQTNPANRPEASFPSIELKIGHAYKGTPKHKRLLAGASPSVVSIDFSLNECILEIEPLEISVGESILVYGFTDLVAEKLRSLLQQPERNRYRRQDVYDLAKLLALEINEGEKRLILTSLLEKSRSRGIEPTVDSLSDPEVRRRAQADYGTLADEVQEPLPDFASAYQALETFYRSLSW
jgi:hypothetical protein